MTGSITVAAPSQQNNIMKSIIATILIVATSALAGEPEGREKVYVLDTCYTDSKAGLEKLLSSGWVTKSVSLNRTGTMAIIVLEKVHTASVTIPTE